MNLRQCIRIAMTSLNVPVFFGCKFFFCRVTPLKHENDLIFLKYENDLMSFVHEAPCYIADRTV